MPGNIAPIGRACLGGTFGTEKKCQPKSVQALEFQKQAVSHMTQTLDSTPPAISRQPSWRMGHGAAAETTHVGAAPGEWDVNAYWAARSAKRMGATADDGRVSAGSRGASTSKTMSMSTSSLPPPSPISLSATTTDSDTAGLAPPRRAATTSGGDRRRSAGLAAAGAAASGASSADDDEVPPKLPACTKTILGGDEWKPPSWYGPMCCFYRLPSVNTASPSGQPV